MRTRAFARRTKLSTRGLHDSPGRDSAGSSGTEPAKKKPTIRRLTQPCTNQTAAETTINNINRPHASRPTWNQPDMQGVKQERRATGWRHHRAPRRPTAIPTGTIEHRNSTIIQLTNLRQRTTSNPRPPGRAQARPSQDAEYASRHASLVVRASSSRLRPTKQQWSWGCLQDRAFGLAPGPWALESGG